MNELVLEKFQNAIHCKKMIKPSVIGTSIDIYHGDILELYFRLDENENILDLKYKTFGGVMNIAMAEVLCEVAVGKNIADCDIIMTDTFEAKLGEIEEEYRYIFQVMLDCIKSANHKLEAKKQQKIKEEQKRLEQEKQKPEEKNDKRVKVSLVVEEKDGEPVKSETIDINYDELDNLLKILNSNKEENK